MRRRASPALARCARSAATSSWPDALIESHAAVPRTGARALASLHSADLVPRSTPALLVLRQPSLSLRRSFASGHTRSTGIHNTNSASLKQSVSAEHFDELKAFLMEPTTGGATAARAKEIVTTMMQQHVFASMPGQEATVMAMVADAMADYSFTIDVYKCLRDAHVSPSPVTLELTAEACAAVGDWQIAGEVVARMHDAVDVMHSSPTIYEHAIAACSRAGKWMKAKQLLDAMLTDGLVASSETHVACLALTIAAHEPTATRALLTRFLATDFDDQAPADITASLRRLFDDAVAASALDDALLLRDALVQCDDGTDAIAFDQRACGALVQLCGVARQWHTARVVLAQFLGVRPPVVPPSSQYLRDVRALLGDLTTHGYSIELPLYNAALRNLAQLSQYEDAKCVFADMEARGVAPDAVTFAAMIAACGTDVAAADALFTNMKHCGIAPSLDACHAVLLVPSRARAWTHVLDRYNALTQLDSVETADLERDARIQSLVAVAFGRSGQSAAVLDVFTRMKVRGLTPNLHVYGEAMAAYVAVGQWRHALLLFDHVQHEGVAPRKLAAASMLWDTAVLAAATGEQRDQAAALFDRIVADRATISPHTAVRLIELLEDVPVATLWDAFRPMPHLHRVRKQTATQSTSYSKALDNPKVLNVALKRAVDTRDVYFAEKLMADAAADALRLNSMTYSLLLRLYADRVDTASFSDWCNRMADACVKPTVFTFRAVLQHLASLDDVGDDHDTVATTVAAVDALLDLGVPDDPAVSISAADVGALVLDAMDRHALPLDALCCEFFLRLSPASTDAMRVLDALEAAPNDFHYSAGLLHAACTTLCRSEPERVRAFVTKCVDKLPRALADDALAAFCAAAASADALALLQTLLATRSFELSDDRVVLFLLNAMATSDSDGESDESEALGRSSRGALPRLAAVLKAADAPLESGSMAFLIQHIVALAQAAESSSSSSDDGDAAADLRAAQDLLVHALSGYARETVHEFVAQVVAPVDAVYLADVLKALEQD